MSLLLLGLALTGAGGMLALFLSRAARWSSVVGAVSVVGGAVLGLVPAVRAVLGAPPEALVVPWPLPAGALSVELDALSGFFLLPILLVSALAAVYGVGYLRPSAGRKGLGIQWLSFNVLVISMVLVVVAANAVLFLVAWETMALSSFFLVTFEHEKNDVRDAGWSYLVATHIGTAFLLVMFVFLGEAAGSYDFNRFAGASSAAPTGLLFVFAIVGFGTKAGFMPFHVWLPEAHPAAPSHVSAVMSGVMIKTGIYGLLRLILSLGPPPPWWGVTLIAIGLSSGVLGVLFAIAQHDLKRLLAYSSVENIGIICLGLGLGLLGLSYDLPALAVLGFAGGLLHVVNHGLFKSLLFLGAGAVLHGTGTRDIEQLGGLLRRLPWSGATFLVGAAAICGLPPLCGFVSEFLIYAGAFGSASAPRSATVAVVGAVVAAFALALIGGLAAACFTRAFGIVFLGEPRTEPAAQAHEAGWAMRLPMLLLAALCFAIGFFPSPILRGLGSVLGIVTASSVERVTPLLTGTRQLVSVLTWCAAGLLCVILFLVALRWRLLVRRSVLSTVTWDCGYAAPTARMQYTASSFAEPLTQQFSVLLGTSRRATHITGAFPEFAALSTDTPDVFRRRVFDPLFHRIGVLAEHVRVLQLGRVQIYVLYVVLTLIALLVWNLA